MIFSDILTESPHAADHQKYALRVFIGSQDTVLECLEALLYIPRRFQSRKHEKTIDFRQADSDVIHPTHKDCS